MNIEERIIVFLDDLKTFNERVLLNNYTDSSYMSSSYFTSNEIDEFKLIEVDGKTLNWALGELFRKKQVFSIVVSHVLPIITRMES